MGRIKPAAAIEIGTKAPPPRDWINLVAKIQLTFGSLWKIFDISGLKAVNIDPNKKINNDQSKIFTGIISGAINGLTTLGGMIVALSLLVANIQPAVIRGSLAALFFITDAYAFILSSIGGVVDMVTIYRVLPLIIILPIGVFIGNKFFIKSKEQLYRKVVLYFLIVISIFGILRIISSI